MRKVLAVAFFVSLGAQAQFYTVPTVNLDKPGALAALAQEKPADYRRVMEEVRRAERMDCRVEMKLYRAGAKLRGGPCPSYFIATSYPAKTHVSVAGSSALYTITAYIDPKADRMAPAR